MFHFFKRLASSVANASAGKVRFFVDENGLPKVKNEAGAVTDFVGPQGDSGISAYQVAVNNGFVGSESAWLASLVGPQGISAYQVAVANGFVGTQSAWLASLVGAQGISAYQVAVNNGFVGSQSAWLSSLVGAQGISAYQVAVNNGFVGSESAWLASLVGPQGISAYQVAVNNGFVGTQSAWLTSLIGAQGISAYQVAVNNGFVGTQSAWLASLVGAQGTSAYQTAVNNGFVGSESAWLASLVGPTGPSGPSLLFSRLTSILSTTSTTPQVASALQIVIPPTKFAQVITLAVVQSVGATTGVGIGLRVVNPANGSTSDLTWAIDNPVAATNTNSSLYDGDYAAVAAGTIVLATSLATASSSNTNQVVRAEAHIYNPSTTQSLTVNVVYFSETNGVSVSLRPGSAISAMLS